MNASHIPDRLRRLEPLWGVWVIDQKIGEGAFGTVYRVTRRDNEKYLSAMKWIPLPANSAELEALRFKNRDPQTYYEEMKNEIEREIDFMRNLRVSNVVSYEDHLIESRTDGPGLDILIRMELLESLSAYIAETPVSLDIALRLGIDICNALSYFEQEGIIHRDIKPGNILVARRSTGMPVFKIGDFGVARKLDQNAGNMTRIGTPNFIAPEVFNRGHYDHRADIYSLGLVMYHLLNKRAGPFLSPEDGREREDAANQRRMRGETLAKPAEASDAVWSVLQRACAFKPVDRYANADAFRSALESLGKETSSPPVQTGKGQMPGQEDRRNKNTMRMEDDAGENRNRNDHTAKLIDTDELIPAFHEKPAAKPPTSEPVEVKKPDPEPPPKTKTGLRKLLLFLLPVLLVLGIVLTLFLTGVFSPRGPGSNSTYQPPTGATTPPPINISIEEVGLYLYSQKHLIQRTMKEIFADPAQSASLIQAVDNSVVLPNRELTETDNSLCLRVKASGGSPLSRSLSCAFKWSGGQLASSAYAFDSSNNLCLVEMRMLLNSLWAQNGNRWPGGAIQLEITVDGKVARTLSFTIRSE